MKSNKTAAVIIPIYKDIPTDDEKKSFLQGISILSSHDIFIVTYPTLDIKYYVTLSSSIQKNVIIEYFDKSFFLNIEGYNKLCLSYEFYNRFNCYDYMLIYQLDAWVFSDQLNYWCSKNYDYIGAPWFEDFGSYEEGKKMWITGNGGFSLRKISYFTKVLSWKFPLMKVPFRKLHNYHYLLYFFGRKNTISYFSSKVTTNEDGFYSINMRNSWIPPIIPSPDEAKFFSMEKSPKYLYEKNGNKLPFGCHAYKKYQFEEFWSNYIYK